MKVSCTCVFVARLFQNTHNKVQVVEGVMSFVSVVLEGKRLAAFVVALTIQVVVVVIVASPG